MSMVDRQRYRQHSYFDGGSSAGDHSSSVSAQDVGESQVIDGKDMIPARCQMIEHCTSTIFLLPDEHFHQDSFIARGAGCYCFSYRSWNVFVIYPPSF